MQVSGDSGLAPWPPHRASPEPPDVPSGREGAQTLTGPPLVLQTKKYADVIIPRGVDNMGKNRPHRLPGPIPADPADP